MTVSKEEQQKQVTEEIIRELKSLTEEQFLAFLLALQEKFEKEEENL